MAELDTTAPEPVDDVSAQGQPTVGSQAGESTVRAVDPSLPAIATDAADAARVRSLVTRALFGGEAEAPRVGHFFLHRRVGRGGMGVVYAGYDARLDRKVAIKILHRSNEPSKQIGMLLREARALAKLSHPNVVTVHDVGVHEEQVYVAMDFIEGSTIDGWIGKSSPSWREVLAAYLKAGEGLVAAHREGIVHRDFKPANVLVGDDGRVCVADFGLASDRSPGPTHPEAVSGEDPLSISGRELSVTGAIVGTPAYMAPEQHEGRRADERSDQFSFCVSLYLGVYGERPFPGETAVDIAVRVTTGAVAEAPSDTPVPSWLRAVLLRGLRRQPSERFSSMQALLKALRDDPTVARKRVAKWAVAGVAVAGAAYVGSRYEGARPCEGGPAAFAEAWNEARKGEVVAAFEATRLEYVGPTSASVAQTLDDYATAWIAGHRDACEATRVRQDQSAELLDNRMRCLDGRRREFSALVDVFADADADVVKRAVRAAASLPAVAPCADLKYVAARVEPPPAELAEAVDVQRDALAQVAALTLAGRWPEALKIALATEAQAESLGYAPLLADAQHRVARHLQFNGEFEPARAKYHAAFDVAFGSGDDEIAAEAAIGLVYVLGHRLGEHERALQWGRTARAALQRLGEDRSERKVHLLGFEGVVYEHLGRYPESVAANREAVAIGTELWGEDSVRLAVSLTNLGSALFAAGDREGSGEVHQRSLELKQKHLGPRHPSLAVSLHNVATVHQTSGRLRRALELYERSSELDRATIGEHHPDYAFGLAQIADAQCELGDLDKGLQTYTRAIEILREALGPNDFRVGQGLFNLATEYFDAGRFEEALETHKESLGVIEASVGRKHVFYANGLAAVAQAERALGRNAAALERYEEAHALQLERVGADHLDTAATELGIANTLRALDRPADAVRHLQRAIAVFDPQSKNAAAAHSALAEALKALGRDEDADAATRQADAIRAELARRSTAQ